MDRAGDEKIFDDSNAPERRVLVRDSSARPKISRAKITNLVGRAIDGDQEAKDTIRRIQDAARTGDRGAMSTLQAIETEANKFGKTTD